MGRISIYGGPGAWSDFFVVPALAATSVVGERRRGTLMLVQLSLLRRFDIVWGAVVASIAPVLFPAWVCVISGSSRSRVEWGCWWLCEMR
ncbi:MAG: hypothetical protein OXI96_05780, partial [Acidimicrobiaceae bacterium]|nr:hypothetical protein [Acidimicrobiaceae bacterium]